MAERVRLAIVGCGGMGRRHLAGLADLTRTDHCNVELEIQDIVFPIQKRAHNFFVGSLAFEFGVNLVIDSWLQTIDLVLTCLIRLERPDDIGLHVLQEYSCARKRFAAQILDDSVNILRFGACIASRFWE